MVKFCNTIILPTIVYRHLLILITYYLLNEFYNYNQSANFLVFQDSFNYMVELNLIHIKKYFL